MRGSRCDRLPRRPEALGARILDVSGHAANGPGQSQISLPLERVSVTQDPLSFYVSFSPSAALGCPSTTYRSPRFRGASLRLSAPSSTFARSRLPCGPAGGSCGTSSSCASPLCLSRLVADFLVPLRLEAAADRLAPPERFALARLVLFPARQLSSCLNAFSASGASGFCQSWPQ